MEIYGNWATLVLPINEDESIDYERFEQEIDRLIEAGVNGIYSNGTAGEFFTLTPEEFMTTTAIFASKCSTAHMPFQIGCSYFSGQIMLERIRFAKKFHPTAIQVTLPEWFPVTNQEAIAFLRRAAEEAEGIPLVLYNPPHAKRILKPQEFMEILEAVPAVRSIKVCDGDEQWYESMREVLAATAVFIPGHHLATGVAHGAKGAYSNVAELSPYHAQKWYNLMITDLPAAMEVEKDIQRFMRERINPLIVKDRHPNFAVDKYMAQLGGWCEIESRIRFPYASVPQDHLEEDRRAYREMIPFFQTAWEKKNP